MPPGVKVEKSTKAELMDLRATWQVSLSLSLSLSLRVQGLFLYTFVSFFIWGTAIDSSGVLLSHPVISLASHMTIILISTLF